jgi:hypothetical protein
MGGACKTHGRVEKCIQNCGWETQGKRLLRRPRHRSEDNVRMHLR